MVTHEYQQLFCMQNQTFSLKKRLVSLSEVIFIFKVRINLYFTFVLISFLLITKTISLFKSNDGHVLSPSVSSLPLSQADLG